MVERRGELAWGWRDDHAHFLVEGLSARCELSHVRCTCHLPRAAVANLNRDGSMYKKMPRCYACGHLIRNERAMILRFAHSSHTLRSTLHTLSSTLQAVATPHETFFFIFSSSSSFLC